MPEKHRSTVHSNDLLGLRFVLLVFSLAVPIESRGQEMQTEVERREAEGESV